MPDITAEHAEDNIDQLKAAADRAIAACGDMRATVEALIITNHLQEAELEKLRAAISAGYARGKLLPRDRKDWYD
jgi:hypothetical protein